MTVISDVYFDVERIFVKMKSTSNNKTFHISFCLIGIQNRREVYSCPFLVPFILILTLTLIKVGKKTKKKTL